MLCNIANVYGKRYKEEDAEEDVKKLKEITHNYHYTQMKQILYIHQLQVELAQLKKSRK